MLVALSEMRGYAISASDGSIGKASDFYFDDDSWTIRYLVVDTGWLFGRKVLIAPDAVEGVQLDESAIAVSLTKDEIKDGPGVDTDLPVSRQDEVTLREHYTWPAYWHLYPGTVAAAPLDAPAERQDLGETPAVSSAEADIREAGGPNLRSAKEVEGYNIEAKDGGIGHVEDFLVDSDSWSIRYVIIDTKNWLPGRKVLVAPDWAERIDWTERLFIVDLDRETIKNSPEFDPSAPLDRENEKAIYDYYGIAPYWV